MILTLRNSWQSLPTVVVYVRHLTVHNNVCIMHSTYTANLRSSFERLIPSGIRHSFALLLSAAANKWCCGILDEITLCRKFEVPWGCGVQSGWGHSWIVISLIACSESRVWGIIARFSKIERTEKNLRHNYLKSSNSECVACASVKGRHVPSCS